MLKKTLKTETETKQKRTQEKHKKQKQKQNKNILKKNHQKQKQKNTYIADSNDARLSSFGRGPNKSEEPKPIS